MTTLRSIFILICLGILLVGECLAQNDSGKQSQTRANRSNSCDSDKPDSRTVYASFWDEKVKDFVQISDIQSVELFEGKSPLEIRCVSRVDEPATVGILLDLSGSMNFPNSPKNIEIAAAVKGVITFINKSDPRNQYFIVAFASDAVVLLETTRERPKIAAALSAALSMKPNGDTNIYNAIDVALKHISASSDKKKVLIMISDGIDNETRGREINDTITHLKESKAMLYLVNMVRDEERQVFYDSWRRTGLEELTQNTGGHVWFPSKKTEMDIVFGLLAAEILNQYTIGFAPLNEPKKRWHKLRLEIHSPKSQGKLEIRYPDGYYF